MSCPTPTGPIQIRIAPSLSYLADPLITYLHTNPSYDNLVVGACIFAPENRRPNGDPPRLLLVQRAAAECGFPNLWEVPGGSAEATDPTIFHSIAREVFEETGLKLTRIVGAVGDGCEFTTGGNRKWKKLTFEIEVQEDSADAGHGMRDPSTDFHRRAKECRSSRQARPHRTSSIRMDYRGGPSPLGTWKDRHRGAEADYATSFSTTQAESW